MNANLGESLNYCPAPGAYSNNDLSGDKLKRKVRSLPPSFRITDVWIRRFWEIATTTQLNTSSNISFCGICLLHSYQVIAELHENYIRGPVARGGYFFDTAAGADPFVSFRQRFPELAERLEGTMVRGRMPLLVGEDINTRTMRINYAMALTMLANYHITPSRHETDLNAIQVIIDNMFAAPVGTIWITGFLRNISGVGIEGHAQPVLRTENGLLFIPTNTPNMSYANYQALFANSLLTDTMAVINFLSNSQSQNLVGFISLTVDQNYQNRVNMFLSNNNCTGLGDDRRGNRRFPSSFNVNQCGMGRCAIQ